jgi:hypothetical protein
MLDGEREPGWKPSVGAVGALIVAALALASVTCWAFKINPLPTSGNPIDSGWFVTFGLVYFLVLYLVVARLRRR